MTPRFSAYLDGLRVVAAFVVLLSHLAYARFTRGDYLVIRDYNLGSDAVILFFVLSGFVIALAAAEKDRTPGAYLFNRATRLLSVALPALLLTYGFDHAGAALDPTAYDGWWWRDVPLPGMLFAGLTFSSEWGPFGLRLGTNGPYWSLSYEAAYYLLFGIAFFMKGWRRIVLLVLVALMAGPRVLLLMPSWLMGVALYRWRHLADPWPRWKLILAAVLPPLLYGLFLAAGTPKVLMILTRHLLEPGTMAYMRFSDEFLWNGLLGLLVSVHLVGMRGLLRGDVPGNAGIVIRWFAGASFSVYLVHYPTLQFLSVAIPQEWPPLLRDLSLLLGALAVCLAFAQAFERTLPRLRRFLRPTPAQTSRA